MGWMHAKLTLVLLMAVFHAMCSRWRKQFAAGKNKHHGKFYRWANEVPTLLLVAIVLLAVLKPF
jgi:putative membrane protein